MRHAPLLAAFASLALAGGAACATAQEAGISFLDGAQGDPARTIAFAMDRGEWWEDVAAHDGPFDSRSYDYRLTPGETVRVRARTAGAGGADVSVIVPVRVEDDIAYALVASVAASDPTHMCMGCGRPASTPLDPAKPDAERLWLYETFNGISSPIMF